MNELCVKEATSGTDLESVYRLTHDVYVREGYASPRVDGMLRHYPHLDESDATRVIVVTEGERVVGTCSYTLDGPDGLHVDTDFPETMQELRKRYSESRLASSWRIVTDPDVRAKPVIRLLQDRVAMDLWVLADVLFCDFHWKHERVYQKLWGMRTVAKSDSIPSLEHAPAVLMMTDMETLMMTHRSRRKPT